MTCAPLVATGDAISGPLVLAVMDGVGIGVGDEADAVARARTPNLDGFARQPLSLALAAHGTAVGMPSDADMGNSEVGHNAIGAGRIFSQGAKLVQQALGSGDLFAGETWQQLTAYLGRSGGALHLIGLLSDGNVHSHIDHIEALASRAAHEGIGRLFVHALLDGRDVPRTSALDYIDHLEAHLAPLHGRDARCYRIASGGGRMVTTMDRYGSDWRIVQRGWQAHVLGEGRGFASARAAVETLRAETPAIGDQDLAPFVITEAGAPVGTVADGDAVVLCNFRGDRMLQICAAFEEAQFEPFERVRRPDIFFCGMTLYDGDTQRPRRYLVTPPQIQCTLGELLCDAGVTQLACSETQKFGHVTYFFNGNRSGAFDDTLERYVEIPSLPPRFDAAPAMRAPAITDVALRAIADASHRFIRLNYANGDMVGHTGNLEATIAAVEAVDLELGRLHRALQQAGGALIVTADHGNADDMAERDNKSGAILRDASGRMQARTSHSLNPVPCHLLLPPLAQGRWQLVRPPAPSLGHLAATVASLLGFERPAAFLPSLLLPCDP